MNKTVTNFCYFAGIGLNVRLETALSDAGVTEPNDLCRRISAYMLHSKSENTVKSTFRLFKSGTFSVNNKVIPLYRKNLYTLCFI